VFFKHAQQKDERGKANLQEKVISYLEIKFKTSIKRNFIDT